MVDVIDNKFEAENRTGPLSILQQSLTNNTQIMINCRNNKKLLGRVKSFDRHMNIILENVHEMWTEEPRKSKGKQVKKQVYKERFMQRVFLRGDSIIIVLKNPNRE